MTEDYRESIPRKVRKTDLKAQVEEELLRFIKHMDLSVNSKLPREEELARMLGVVTISPFHTREGWIWEYWTVM